MEDLIGKVVDGIRRTKTGFVKEDTDWWFFQRDFPEKEQAYWYAKKRGEDDSIIEEYVGIELPFRLPRELMTPEEYVRYINGKLIIEQDTQDVNGRSSQGD